MSSFYKSVFKAWTLFERGSQGPAVSLHWLLEEPLVGGGRLDIRDTSAGLTQTLLCRNITTLRRLVDAAGPDFKDTKAVAKELGLRSLRHTESNISKWINSTAERALGAKQQPRNSNVPKATGTGRLWIRRKRPNEKLLSLKTPELKVFKNAGKKALYYACVKVMHLRALKDVPESKWQDQALSRTR
ncbi:uncharacterized protein LOC121202558 [Tachysurus ichikawai]